MILIMSVSFNRVFLPDRYIRRVGLGFIRMPMTGMFILMACGLGESTLSLLSRMSFAGVTHTKRKATLKPQE